MSWVSLTGRLFFYISVPFTVLFRSLLIALSPILHLTHFVASACFLPIKLLAKLETLYIFLGVAASIGLISSIVLYTSSAILISIFNLSPVPEQSGRTATSVRAIQEKKRREQEWQSSTVKNDDLAWRSDVSMAKYAEWLGKRGKGSRREDGLLGQTILEEDDDSDIF